MKKLLMLILSVFISLHSYNYDDILLKAQVKLYPKIILLDKRYMEDKNKHITLTIVYHPSDFQKAKYIRELLEKEYENWIENTKVYIDIVTFQDVDQTIKTSAIYLLKSDPTDTKRICKIAQKKHIPVFSYDLNDLKNGALISLYIKERPILYLNQKMLNKYDIDFSDTFYQIVRYKYD